MARSHHLLRWLLPLILLAALAALLLFWGGGSLTAAEVWRTLLGRSEDAAARTVVFELRLPAVVCAVLSGAALAVGGLLMQTVFANPLADPSILGVNSGAGLGVAVAVLLMGGSWQAGGVVVSGFFLTMLAAFVGAAVVVALLLLCNRLLAGNLLLLIAGVMLSLFASSLIALLSFFATEQGVQSYLIWGMGSFGSLSAALLPHYAACIGVCLVWAWLLAKPLNALLLGDAYAQNAGFNVRSIRAQALLLTGLLTAFTTAVCGPVAFLGLAVPHAARFGFRTSDHRTLLPATMLWGAAAAAACLWVSRLPRSGGVLPLNAITPLLGVPVVFWLLLRRRDTQ